MPRWPIRQVDKLIYSKLADDATIKTKMGIASAGKARVSGYRVVTDKAYFPYIYFYSLTGPVTHGQGTVPIQRNVDYVIEVRTVGAPTTESEAIVDRIDELIGTMVKDLTADGNWVVSARLRSELSITEQGETPEIFYMRRGGTYKLAVVRS